MKSELLAALANGRFGDGVEFSYVPCKEGFLAHHVDEPWAAMRKEIDRRDRIVRENLAGASRHSQSVLYIIFGFSF